MNTLVEQEEQRQIEQNRLDASSENGGRNKLGQFATPSELADEIMQYMRRLWRKKGEPLRFLEPAIGTGAFYSALCRAFPERTPIEGRGFELDDRFVEAAIELWQASGLQISQGDFTRQKAPEKDERFNLVVTNPPYVRHHHLSQTEKLRLKKRVLGELGIEMNGLAGLYCYFLLLADAWLAEDGLAAWLIPSEFMDVKYGAAVKQYLTRHVKLLHIHRFLPMDVQFTDAQVSSVVVIFEKSVPAPEHRVSFALGGSLLSPQLVREVSIGSLKASDKWTKYSTCGTESKESKEGPKLGDFFTIKRGLATGANGFFIMPRDKARVNGIPEQFLKPILPSPRMLPSDVVESDTDGYPRLPTPLALVDCKLTETEIRRAFPEFWRYLESGKREHIEKGYLASRRSPWYSQERRDPVSFLCTYMGRTNNGRKPFRFIWNQSKATAHNVYLLLYPRGALKDALQTDPALSAALFALLRKIDTNTFIPGGRVYGGGLYKMEPKELAQMSAAPLSDLLKRLDYQGTREMFV